MRVGAAEVAEELQPGGLGGGAGHRHGHADESVGPEPGLGGGAVEIDQRLVHQPLVVGLVAEQLGLDLVHDAVDGPADALAAVLGPAVAELDRLERAGGRTAWHPGAAEGAIVKNHLDLDGRVTPGVQDLPGMYRFNGRHH